MNTNNYDKKSAYDSKTKYIAPGLKVTLVELEQGIAAGSASAKVMPTDQVNNNVMESWETDQDENRTFDW